MNRTFDATTVTSNQDWSKFDFTQWNLEGLQLDTQTAALSGWLRDVTISPQAPQKFAAGLTTIKSAIQNDLQSQIKTIQDQSAALNEKLNARVALTQKQISAHEENLRVAGAPLAPNPDPASFQLAAKVVDQSTRLGLAGLQIRLYDTRSSITTLASAVTDVNGNALFKLGKDQATNLNQEHAALALEVLTPAGKSLHDGGQTVIPTLNQVDTLVATIASPPELAPYVNRAKAVNAQQQSTLTALPSRLDALRAHYQQAQNDLKQQLTQLRAILSGSNPI